LPEVVSERRSVDGTRKWPEEGFTRRWPDLIEMDAATKEKGAGYWDELGIEGARSGIPA
jgi:4-hydroxy-3-polyprenylbenzoate decarboxylase